MSLSLSPFGAKPKSAMETGDTVFYPIGRRSNPSPCILFHCCKYAFVQTETGHGGISYLSLCLSIDCVLFRLPEIVEAEGGNGKGPGWAAHKKASKLYSTWTESRERSGSKIRWIKFEFKYSTSLVLPPFRNIRCFSFVK
jgi:hypothetical protein